MHLFRRDGQEACFGSLVSRMVAATLGTAQDLEPGAEWAVAAGIGGAVDADDGAAESTSEMEGSGVAGNDEGDAAGDSNELLKRRQERTRASACSLHDGVGKQSFAGAGVDEDAKTAPQQNPRHIGITFGGPALGAPACAGIDEGRGRAFVFIA